MSSLRDAQANFIDTINDGPDRLDPSLFVGPKDRIMLGLKAHANTISHARLVALEETFQLTRHQMGKAAFNQLSRDYVDSPFARSIDNNRIGRDFGAFLRDCHVDVATAQLADIEWAWLESYHAADAVALSREDLAAADETTLLGWTIAVHPSARIVQLSAPLTADLEELAAQQPHSILAVRPEVDVRLVALDRTQSVLLAHAAKENCNMRNLLVLAFEVAGEQAPLEPILYLIGAGALVKTG